MMKSIFNDLLKYCIKVAIGLLTLTTISSTNCTKNNDSDHSIKEETSLQKKTDLLAGFPNAVAYSGFRDGQHPDRGTGAVNPSDDQISEDLNILVRNPNFRLIRLYDSAANSESVLRLIREHEFDIKVMLGIWLDAEISNHNGCAWLTEPIPDTTLANNKQLNNQEIMNGIRLANEYSDIVVAVNVGNEALVEWTDHKVSLQSIVAYVRKVTQAIVQPVTVADSYGWWKSKGATLANEVDFLAVHIYPIWEGKDIDEGLSYTIESVKSVKNAFPGRRIVISEAGWATVATEFGDRASEEKQRRYYSEITQWAKQNNITTFFFEAFDENWKGDPENPSGAEKHWGLFTVDRNAKLVMYDQYPDLIPMKRYTGIQ